VQTGGGCGNGARIFGKHRLVTVAIRDFVGTIDIRRERHVAEALEMFADGVLVVRNESQRAQPEFPACQHRALKFAISK
jgi:hypothetical protein